MSEPVPAYDSAPAEQARWFSEQVHAHHGSLKAYLHRAYPDVRDVDDVVQESYLRIWRRHLANPVVSAKAFLYQVARHVALDRLRRDRVSPMNVVGDLAGLSVIEDRPSAAEAAGREENIRLLSEGLATLPPRGREILRLRKFEGLSQKQVASMLEISEKTVDEHLARAMKRLGRYLRRKGVSGHFDR